jgi:hypothetical protein
LLLNLVFFFECLQKPLAYLLTTTTLRRIWYFIRYNLMLLCDVNHVWLTFCLLQTRLVQFATLRFFLSFSFHSSPSFSAAMRNHHVFFTPIPHRSRVKRHSEKRTGATTFALHRSYFVSVYQDLGVARPSPTVTRSCRCLCAFSCAASSRTFLSQCAVYL